MSDPTDKPKKTRRELLAILPLGAIGIGGFAFWKMLQGLQDGSFDPHAISTPVIDKPVPPSPIPTKDSSRPFSYEMLKAPPTPILVNFFASWCIPCLQENSTLMKLRHALPIWGIAYKDKPANTEYFLSHSGNPYQYMAYDQRGVLGIDWGVSGVPESFLIDRDGFIRWHSAIPLQDQDIPTLMALRDKISKK